MRSWFVFLILMLTACEQVPPQAEVPRAVRTVKLSAGDFGEETFAAEIRARWESSQAFLLAGRIVAREVELGERVAKHQVLLRLDDADMRLDLAAKSAAKSAAEQNFLLKNQELTRFLNLQPKGFVSQVDIERLSTARDAARETLKQAQAAEKLSAKRLNDTVLRAEQAGVVAALTGEVGQVVAAGQVVAQLADWRALEARFFISELARSSWQVGDALEVELWADAPPIAARVRELAATADPTTRMFAVRAELLETPENARIGASARVIRRLDLAKSMAIPLSALASENGQHFVWRLDNKTLTVKKIPVEVANLTSEQARIASGLRGDEEIVTAGVQLLREGQKVRKLAPERAGKAAIAEQ